MNRFGLTLLDADSIVHVVAYNHRDNEFNLDAVKASVDSFVKDILNETNTSHYLGFMGNIDSSVRHDTFRHRLAVTKPYKGNRKEASAWIKLWRSPIMQHMADKWKFIQCSNVEADDMCCIYQDSVYLDPKTNKISLVPTQNYEPIPTIISSPDKDLKQAGGAYYDYRKMVHTSVSIEEGNLLLWSQVLTGDSTDNIPGLPRCGEKGAAEILKGIRSYNLMEEAVTRAYEAKGMSKEYLQEQFYLINILKSNPSGFPVLQEAYPFENTEAVISFVSAENTDSNAVSLQAPTFKQ